MVGTIQSMPNMEIQTLELILFAQLALGGTQMAWQCPSLPPKASIDLRRRRALAHGVSEARSPKAQIYICIYIAIYVCTYTYTTYTYLHVSTHIYNR